MECRPLSVIALHGVAVSDDEIDAAARMVKSQINFPEIRWVFPKASLRPVTILNGYRARAWYDIHTYDRRQIDARGLEEAATTVHSMVRSERQHGPGTRSIVLLGFSQGGALALHAGLGVPGEVDGIVALATALPFPDRIPRATDVSPRLFIGHGFLDPKVSYADGWETCRFLRSRGYETEWHTYALGHTTGLRQLRDVGRWLDVRFRSRLPSLRLPSSQESRTPEFASLSR